MLSSSGFCMAQHDLAPHECRDVDVQYKHQLIGLFEDH